MARLTSGQRKRMPNSMFALPSQRKYPIPDKAHGRNALARVAQQLKKGNISKADAAKVIAAVCRKFGDFPSCSKRKKTTPKKSAKRTTSRKAKPKRKVSKKSRRISKPRKKNIRRNRKK